MRMTGLPYEVVCGWTEQEADLWARAAAVAVRECRDLIPDESAALMRALLSSE